MKTFGHIVDAEEALVKAFGFDLDDDGWSQSDWDAAVENLGPEVQEKFRRLEAALRVAATLALDLDL